MTYIAETDPATALGPLQAAACTYRIALGPPGCCVSEHGFSLHAEVCCAAHQRKKLESQGQGLALLGAPRMQHLCRYNITRHAIANERLALNRGRAGAHTEDPLSRRHDGTW